MGGAGGDGLRGSGRGQGPNSGDKPQKKSMGWGKGMLIFGSIALVVGLLFNALS